MQVLTFSVDATSGEPLDNLILFTTDGATGAFGEKRREDEGFIYPIVYVDAVAAGHKLDRLPGGFYQTHIDWNTTLDYQVIARESEVIFDVVNKTDAVVVSVTAVDNMANAPIPSDVKYFDIIRKDRGGGGVVVEDITTTTTTSTNGATSGACSSFRYASFVGAIVSVVLLILTY